MSRYMGRSYLEPEPAIQDPSWAADRYYFVPNAPSTSTSSTMGVGTLRAVMFKIPSASRLTKIGAEVTTAGETGSKYRLGLYRDDGTGRPGSLIVDAGQIAADAVARAELTIDQMLASGWYWAAGVVQAVVTTQPTMRTATGFMSPVDGFGSTPGANQLNLGMFATGVTDALPSTLIGASGLGFSQSVPRIFVKT